MITVTAFRNVPPFAQGLVRDLRVRWALEEAGIPYQVRLIDQSEQMTPGYLAKNPFGKIPVYEEGDGFILFESGAIVLHIAEKSEKLLPKDPAARGRAIAWVFASLDTVEKMVMPLTAIDLFYAQEEWAKLRRAGAETQAHERLALLTDALGDKDYLEGNFTAGDLMVTSVLRFLRHCDLVERFPSLKAYQLRCEARPAFQRALDGQMSAFRQAA